MLRWCDVQHVHADWQVSDLSYCLLLTDSTDIPAEYMGCIKLGAVGDTCCLGTKSPAGGAQTHASMLYSWLIEVTAISGCIPCVGAHTEKRPGQ